MGQGIERLTKGGSALVKKWADQISIRVCGYDSFPMPENLVEAWEENLGFGGEVDRDELVAEIEALVGSERPYELDDTYALTAWGAGGGSLTIVMNVSTVVGGVAAAVYIFKEAVRAIRRRAPDHGEVEHSPVQAEGAVDAATLFLGRCLHSAPESMKTERVEPIEGGFRVVLASGRRSYGVEVTAAGPIRLERLS